MSTARIEKLRARYEAARAELIEEFEFMLQAGESPRRITARLGYSNPESLERRLHRAGRHDLAALVHQTSEKRRQQQQARHASRRKPCKAGCGGTCGDWSKHQVCKPCMDRHGLSRALGMTGSVAEALALRNAS